MRRGLSIFLTLLLWASCGGILHFLHDHHAAGAVAHDESTCDICYAHHVPVVSTAVFTVPLVVLEAQPALLVPENTLAPQRTCLTITCRGPPAC